MLLEKYAPPSEIKEEIQWMDRYDFSSMPRERYSIKTGLKARWIKIKFRIYALKIFITNHGFKKNILQIISQLRNKNILIHGKSVLNKWIQNGDKHYFYLYAPGFPSTAMKKMLLYEAERIQQPEILKIRFAFLAITKKCPMQCEHCFEWDNINQKEVLTYENLRTIVIKLIEAGINQLHLSGGEPMLRVHDIIKLAEEFSHEIEIWVLTSGYNGTKENITLLKEAGVTGFVVSLDHYEAASHNKFRGHPQAFERATNTIKYAREANMLVAVSICTVRSFCNQADLFSFLSLAQSLDVSFIQLLEPKAIGHYAQKDVLLQERHQKVLESFYHEVNTSKKYLNSPIIVYHGYYQRQIGCMTGGNRALYVDTNGSALSCPFCHCSSGNFLTDEVSSVVSNLRKKGCSTYGLSTF